MLVSFFVAQYMYFHVFFLEAKLTLKDQNGNTPLHYSIIGHRDDMLSTLIQNRVDPGIINQGLSFVLSETHNNNISQMVIMQFIWQQ